MINKLLLALIVLSSCFTGYASLTKGTHASLEQELPLSTANIDYLPSYWQTINEPTLLNQLINIASNTTYCLKPALAPFNEQKIRDMMQQTGTNLSTAVINKAISTLKCARHYNLDHNQILTLIDYSLPSSEKRLWIFDLNDNKLLFHTYVSHGIKSGELLTNRFSNKNNSKSTSIGVYTTEQTYYGRDGLSLRLEGLDRGFNDNASGRSIVMHGGWYVEEAFIKKYGRPGRSWGCPALPLNMTKPIINTIKDKSIFVAYYPSEAWFAQSRFLKCDPTPTLNIASTTQPVSDEVRDEVLFVAPSKHNTQLDTRAVLAMPADKYIEIFQTQAPLTRMLRRQVNHVEYIALSNIEFRTLVLNHYKKRVAASENPDVLATLNDATTQPTPTNDLESIRLISPTLKMIRGYYETQMNIVESGQIKDVFMNNAEGNSYTLQFEKHSVITLRATDQFVRWVGL